jgi:hypothetical protein
VAAVVDGPERRNDFGKPLSSSIFVDHHHFSTKRSKLSFTDLIIPTGKIFTRVVKSVRMRRQIKPA